MGWGSTPSGTLRFKKIDGSFWNGETFRFADYTKLCLYIPFIQNYFMAGATDEVRDEILSILSHSTQVRRRSNVNTIIHTIKESIDYEL